MGNENSESWRGVHKATPTYAATARACTSSPSWLSSFPLGLLPLLFCAWPGQCCISWLAHLETTPNSCTTVPCNPGAGLPLRLMPLCGVLCGVITVRECIKFCKTPSLSCSLMIFLLLSTSCCSCGQYGGGGTLRSLCI